jgi:hypothetical protein
MSGCVLRELAFVVARCDYLARLDIDNYRPNWNIAMSNSRFSL